MPPTRVSLLQNTVSSTREEREQRKTQIEGQGEEASREGPTGSRGRSREPCDVTTAMLVETKPALPATEPRPGRSHRRLSPAPHALNTHEKRVSIQRVRWPMYNMKNCQPTSPCAPAPRTCPPQVTGRSELTGSQCLTPWRPSVRDSAAQAHTRTRREEFQRRP